MYKIRSIKQIIFNKYATNMKMAISQGPRLCVFVEYDLFNTTNFIQNLIYTFWYNFDTVLSQFLETGTSDRCLTYIVQRLRFSGFILYPLSFFLYSPFKNVQCLIYNIWHWCITLEQVELVEPNYIKSRFRNKRGLTFWVIAQPKPVCTLRYLTSKRCLLPVLYLISCFCEILYRY